MGITCSCEHVLTDACSWFCGGENYIHMMETNLEALENTMKTLEARRNDLLIRVEEEEDKGLQRLDEVQGWFSKVGDLGTQVNDLLESRSTETNRLCLLNYCSEDCLCLSSYKYGEKVSNKLKEATKLLSEGDFQNLARQIPVPKVVKMHIQTTTGLDEMVERVRNSLMKDGRTTLGIYGMGGVGKTTLLTRINNELFKEDNESYFVVSVVVSKELQNGSIQDQILQRLRLDKEWEKETEKEKAVSINNLLSKKKFVLLLDDLWSEVDLNKIGVPPVPGENGSKIVLTTRLKDVCKNMKADEYMQVDCLSSDYAWELFQKEVGETTLKSHEYIPILAKEVAEMCHGLPLALCVIGKTMACKETVQEWRHAIEVLNKSRHKFPGIKEKILPILKFSYDELRDEKVKLCFLYYSLFPENNIMRKDELIEYWICEEFIDGNRDEYGVNNQGHDIIGLLVRAHLLMTGYDSSCVKMHDVVREMALWIVSNFGKQDETLCVKTGAQSSEIPKDIHWEIVSRMSLMSSQIPGSSTNLSTLLLKRKKLLAISGESFRSMETLVVLDLSENESLSVLPEEISTLGSLQYLNLSETGVKSLPVGLKELKKLIYLNLQYTKIQSIAGIVASLPNLQVLKLFNSSIYVDDTLLKELLLLEHLKILTICIEDAKILESIQGVSRLAISIQALGVYNISAPRVTLNPVALSGLQRFDIFSCAVSKIKIVGCGSKEKGKHSPCFKQLSTVYIDKLEGPTHLTWLLFAQNLIRLQVMSSSRIENIINMNKAMKIASAHPNIVVTLGNQLEFLELHDMGELRSICENSHVLPKLEILGVRNCPKLPRAAFEFLGNVNTTFLI